MDLASVLAELKVVDDFKQPDKNLATASFCQRACKVLERVVKQAPTIEFNHLVIGIWIVVGSFNELLPHLVDGTFLIEFVEKLFRECARVVLDIKWQQLDEDEKCRQNFQTALSACHQLMAPRGFTRFGVLQELMDNPWTDPVLTMVMGSEEDNEDGEGLAYIQAQDPEILKLRVELMQQENCDEFALNLCTWCLKHPSLAGNFDIRKTQFFLLHRLGYTDKLQEECQTMGPEDGIQLIKSMQEGDDNKELCTLLAQTFLVQNWIKPSNNEEKKELLRLWIKLQYQADCDREGDFISSLWAVAKLSPSTEQLLFIIDAVREQCGDAFLQFCTDLCVFAINVDKGCFEKLKGTSTTGPNDEILARKRDMAQVCNKLALIVSHVSPKVSFCCALTAFAMMPSEQSLQAVREAHQRKVKSQAGVSSKSQCCSNCASDQGQCLKNDDTDKASREVNIATLYEVERLCGMLRPAYLSPDSDLTILLTLCKQYLMKENGEAVKSALVRRKSAPVAQAPSTAGFSPSQYSAAGTGLPGQGVRPNILRPGPPSASKVVDVQPQPGNLGMNTGVAYSAVSAHGSVLAPGATGQIGQPMVKMGAPGVSQQPDKAVGAAGQQQASGKNAVQRLVLQQLSSDMVQTLLHLIQSGQISPVQLNQIMSKHPNMSVQVLQNLVSQVRQTSKAGAPEQNQQAQPAKQGQQAQGQQQQAQQVRQPQVEVLQQQLQIQRQQEQQKQHLVIQQKPGYGTPQGLHPASIQRAQQQAGLRQPAPQQVRSMEPATAQTRVLGNQVVVQQSVPMQRPAIRPRASNQPHEQSRPPGQQMLQGVQQIQAGLPSISTLRLSSTGEIQVTQPLHVMTFRQSAPIQTAASRVQSTPVLIQTSSQMLSHLSGGNVTSLQQQPRVLRLPSASVTLHSQNIARPDPQVVSQLTLRASGPQPANQGGGVGVSDQAQSSVNTGNRNYSINNLLFTGEQQSSTLSITLPDQLPEIPVDTISDTLRALSDQPSSGGMVAKDLVQQAHMPVSQTVSVVSPQGGQLTMNTVQGVQKQQITNAPKQPAKKIAKKPASKISQVQVLQSASPQTQPQASVCYVAQPQTSQNSQQYGQPLPSFSSLFTPGNQLQQLASTTAASASPPSTSAPAPTSPSRKGAAGQGKGQKKPTAVEKTAAKLKEKLEKGDLMRLLKQVMTINVEGKKNQERSGGESTYLPTPTGQYVTATTGTGSKSVFPAQSISVAVQNQSSPMARPVFQQSSQPGHMSVSAAVSQQPASMAQHSKNLPASAQASNPVPSVASHVPSLASPAATPKPSSALPTTSPLLSAEHYSPFSHSSPKLHNILSGKPSSVQGTTLTTAPGSGHSTLPASGANASPALTFAGQTGVPAVCYSPSTFVPGYMSSTAVVSSGGVESMRTYSRQDSGRSPRRDQQEVVSIPIPASILPEGGIMDMGRDGDQSIATYRCIICAKAFMTLDALRVHVKQICKPGLNQPPNLNTRMAFNKAQATEAGLETSTVFQCMRCFELCISEAGIREHKQVCSKAPKPKSKPKSKAKPKQPKSEEEQATEAKVMELLNKCLGENREKLIEEQNALAAKKANAKKRQQKKRPSTDGDSIASSSSESNPRSKKPKKDQQGSSSGSPASMCHSPNLGQMNTIVAASGPVKAETLQSTAAAMSLPSTALKTEPATVATSVSAPLPATSSAPTSVKSENAGTNSSGDKGDGKPKPKRKYYPKKKKPAEGASGGKVAESETSKPRGHSDTTAKEKKPGSGDAKAAKEKKPKKEPGPPPPRYKELSGSGGRSFFKCLNCGQTLCSIENFSDHWRECIIKKPLPAKPKRSPKEKKPKAENSKSGKSDNTTYSSIESMESTINSVASGSYNLEAVESQDSLDRAQMPDSDQAASTDGTIDVTEGESSQASTVSSDAEPKAVDSEENSDVAGPMSEVMAVTEAPVVFEADTSEVINELQVETTTDNVITLEPALEVKQSLVVLEKVIVPEKGKDSSSKTSNKSGEMAAGKRSKETSKPAAAEKNRKDSAKKSVPKKAGGGLRKVGNKHRKKTGLRSLLASRRREREAKQGDSKAAAKAAAKPQSGDTKYCGLCQRYFDRRIILIQHIASKHVQPYTVRKLGDTSSYFCHLCQRVFPQFSGYMSHVNSHSQAIMKKFSELQSIQNTGAAGRSRRIANQKGTGGRNPGKHGRTSPRDSSKAGGSTNGEEGGARGRLRRFSSPGSTSSAAKKGTNSPSQASDRRSSGRAAQKQALSKIFISSLGITSSAEPLKEVNKRKLSSEDKADTRPKRTRVEKDKTDGAKSGEDEENTEESGGETDQDDVPTAAEDMSSDSPAASAHSKGSKLAEKASMDASAAQSFSSAGPGKPPLSVQCPQGGPSSVNASHLPSPQSSAPKKPSFLDSFLSFVSSRSPEAPLPINQRQRRISNMGNLESESTPLAAQMSRRSSCDTPSASLIKTEPQLPSASQEADASKPLQRSVSISESPKASRAKSPQGTKNVSGAARKKSSDYDNVFYYGKFEEQLTKQCRVLLGDRINPDPPEEAVISVKQCTVNLGPKVSPEALSVAAGIRGASEEADKSKGDSEVESDEVAHVEATATKGCPVEDTPGEEVSLPASDAALQGEALTIQHSVAPPLNKPGEVCVEATLSVLSLPEGSTDVAAVISSMGLQASGQNPASKDCEAASSCMEAVSMSSMSADAEEGALQSVDTGQLKDRITNDAFTCDASNMLVGKEMQPTEKDIHLGSAEEALQMTDKDKDDSAEKAKIESITVVDSAQSEVAFSASETVEESKVTFQTEDRLPDNIATDRTVSGETGSRTLPASSAHSVSATDTSVGFNVPSSSIEGLINDSIERALLNEFGGGSAAPLSSLHPDRHIETTGSTAEKRQAVDAECVSETTTVGTEPAQERAEPAAPGSTQGEIMETGCAGVEPWQATVEVEAVVHAAGDKPESRKEMMPQITENKGLPAESLQKNNRSACSEELTCETSQDMTSPLTLQQAVTANSETLQEATRQEVSKSHVKNSADHTEECGTEETITPAALEICDGDASRQATRGGEETSISNIAELQEPPLSEDKEQMQLVSEGDTIVACETPQEAVCRELSQSSLNLDAVSVHRLLTMSGEQTDTSNDAEKRQQAREDHILAEMPSADLPTERKEERNEVSGVTECAVPPLLSDEEQSLQASANSASGKEENTQEHQQLPACVASIISHTDEDSESVEEERVNTLRKRQSGEDECQINSEIVDSRNSSSLESVPPERPAQMTAEPTETEPPPVDHTGEGQAISLKSISSSSVMAAQSACEQKDGSMSMMDFLMKSAFVIPEPPNSGSESQDTLTEPPDDQPDSYQETPVAVENNTIALGSQTQQCREGGEEMEVENASQDSADISLSGAGQTGDTESSDGGADFDDGGDEDADYDTSEDRVQTLTLPDESEAADTQPALLTPTTKATDVSDSILEPVGEEKLASIEVPTAAPDVLSQVHGSSVLTQPFSAFSMDSSPNLTAEISCEREESVSKQVETLQDVPLQQDPSLQNQSPSADQKTGHVPVESPSDVVDRDKVAINSPTQSQPEQASVAEESALSISSPQSSKSKTAEPEHFDEADPENDLPELCIVPDPTPVVIRKTFERKPERKRVTPPPAEDGTIISAIVEDHEVQIRNLRGTPRKKKTTPETFIAKVVETKTEVVIKKEEEEARPLDSPTRKPLLGVKPLRSVLKPQPFVWEADVEEDHSKVARIERSRKALRQKAQVAPFTWDSDEADNEKGRREEMTTHESMSGDLLHSFSGNIEVTSEMAPKAQPVTNKTESDVPDSENSHKITEAARKKVSATEKVEHGRSSLSTSVNEETVDDTGAANSHSAVNTRRKETDTGSRRKGVASKSALASETTATPKASSTSAEQSRITCRSRNARRPGSFDKSTPRSGQAPLPATAKRAPFRKSRSCDIEGGEFVPKDAPTSAEKQKSIVTDIKTESDTSSKTSAEVDQANDTKSTQDTVELSTKPKPRVLTRSSEKVPPSSSLQKWRSRRSLAGLKESNLESTDVKIEMNTSSRRRIKRGSNLPVQKTETVSAKTEDSSVGRPKVKQEPGTESQPKTPDMGSSGVRTRHNSKNSKQSQKLPDSNQSPASTRSRDTTPDISESPVTDAPATAVSRRGHDTRRSKNAESKTSDNLQAIVRSRRKRTSSNSSTTPVSQRAVNSTPSKRPSESRTSRAASASRESTPTSASASSSTSKLQTPSSSPSLQSGRERRIVPPGKSASQEISPSQQKKTDDTVAPANVKDAPDTAASNTARTDSSKDTAQTPSTQTPKARQSTPEPKYLGAMVRRRQQPASWRTGNTAAAKKQRTPSSKAPQYEIIRVEPVRADSPVDQRRTRSSDKETESSPRTVHTRVSVDELKAAAHSVEGGKAGGDQKWSINRHFLTSHVKKRTADQRFPFSFKRARTKTQTK